ncbi:MAG: DUF1015 domain-containing protein [FCB group bacterium]|nr:DUF1015 domain-containing protein [FCB group bacterium]
MQCFPFRGWRYHPEKIPRPEEVISPPYDVYNDEDARQMQARSPYHFSHIIRNQSPGKDRYTPAADLLREWMQSGILIRDSQPAFYLLRQTTLVQHRPVTRLGVIATLRLEPLGSSILPHEATIPKHVNDRYRLMEATRAQTGQIFLIYQDSTRTVDRLATEVEAKPPLMQFALDGIETSLWAITAPHLIGAIQSALAPAPAIIADGHHRYKTAWQYYQNHPDQPGADQVMVTLVNSANPGLEILPTHRLVRNHTLTLEALRDALYTRGSVPPIRPAVRILNSWNESTIPQIGVVDLVREAGFLATIPPADAETPLLPVRYVHDAILEPVLGLSIHRNADLDNIAYHKGTLAPSDLTVLKGKYRFLFLTPPPTVEDVFQVTRQGATLPQKSTYFYPKVYSGMVIRTIGN